METPKAIATVVSEKIKATPRYVSPARVKALRTQTGWNRVNSGYCHIKKFYVEGFEVLAYAELNSVILTAKVIYGNKHVEDGTMITMDMENIVVSWLDEKDFEAYCMVVEEQRRKHAKVEAEEEKRKASKEQ